MTEFNEKEKEAARNLLWYYGHTEMAHQPGSFTYALIQVMERADAQNLKRLLKAFPEFEKPVVMFQILPRETFREMLNG